MHVLQKKFNWGRHIQQLNSFPIFAQQWEEEFALAVINTIPRKRIKRILEVGCSNGRWLRWFHKNYGCEVHGIDNNPTGFSKDSIINFKSGNAEKLPYKDEWFDISFSIGLIEHFPVRQKYLILKEQCRVLRKGGFFICQVPLLNVSLNFFYMKYAYDYKMGYRHFKTTKKELLRYCKKLGGVEIIYCDFLGELRLFKSRFQKFYQSRFYRKLISYRPVKNFFATEVLLIGKKIG